MPLTPFHFGPSALVGLPFRKRIDLPVFVMSNIFVDLEPVIVIISGANYPLHGFAHTFLFGSLVGTAGGMLMYFGQRRINSLFLKFGYIYEATIKKVIISGILGVWFHILIDSVYHFDILPLYPLKINPLYGLISQCLVMYICLVSFALVMIYYVSKQIFLSLSVRKVSGRRILKKLNK